MCRSRSRRRVLETYCTQNSCSRQSHPRTHPFPNKLWRWTCTFRFRTSEDSIRTAFFWLVLCRREPARHWRHCTRQWHCRTRILARIFRHDTGKCLVDSPSYLQPETQKKTVKNSLTIRMRYKAHASSQKRMRHNAHVLLRYSDTDIWQLLAMFWSQCHWQPIVRGTDCQTCPIIQIARIRDATNKLCASGRRNVSGGHEVNYGMISSR